MNGYIIVDTLVLLMGNSICLLVPNHFLRPKRNWRWILGAVVCITALSMPFRYLQLDPIVRAGYSLFLMSAPVLSLYPKESFFRKLYAIVVVPLGQILAVVVAGFITALLNRRFHLELSGITADTSPLYPIIEMPLCFAFALLLSLPLTNRKDAISINWLLFVPPVLTQYALVCFLVGWIFALPEQTQGPINILFAAITACIGADIWLNRLINISIAHIHSESENRDLRAVQQLQLDANRKLQHDIMEVSILHHDHEKHLLTIRYIAQSDPAKAAAYLNALLAANRETLHFSDDK